MFEEKKRKLRTVNDHISSISCGDCNNSIGGMDLSDLSSTAAHTILLLKESLWWMDLSCK
jgi:hypothetical protein